MDFAHLLLALDFRVNVAARNRVEQSSTTTVMCPTLRGVLTCKELIFVNGVTTITVSGQQVTQRVNQVVRVVSTRLSQVHLLLLMITVFKFLLVFVIVEPLICHRGTPVTVHSIAATIDHVHPRCPITVAPVVCGTKQNLWD